MNLDVFTLRMKPQLKKAIRDRARVENQTQSDLIREAVKEYLLKPIHQIQHGDREPISKNYHAKPKPRQLRWAEARQARLEARNLGTAANQNISTNRQAKKSV